MSTNYLEPVDAFGAEWAGLWERRHRFAWAPRVKKIERKKTGKLREGQPE